MEAQREREERRGKAKALGGGRKNLKPKVRTPKWKKKKQRGGKSPIPYNKSRGGASHEEPRQINKNAWGWDPSLHGMPIPLPPRSSLLPLFWFPILVRSDRYSCRRHGLALSALPGSSTALLSLPSHRCLLSPSDFVCRVISGHASCLLVILIILFVTFSSPADVSPSLFFVFCAVPVDASARSHRANLAVDADERENGRCRTQGGHDAEVGRERCERTAHCAMA